MKNTISVVYKYIATACRKAGEFFKGMGAAAGLPIDNAVTPCTTTVGDVITAHFAAEHELSDKTRRAHERALLNMSETIMRYRRGLARVDHRGRHHGNRNILADYPLGASVPLTKLDEQFVSDYVAATTREFAVESPKWFAAYATAASQVNRVKGMFCTAALAAYRKAGLKIPATIARFRAAESLPKRTCGVVPPFDSRLDGAIYDLRALEACNEAMFLAAALPFFAGLRHGEIVDAHVAWLSVTGATSLRIRAGASCERIVPIPEWLHTRLRCHDGYFISGATARERHEKCSATAKWLRQHGSAGVALPLAEYRMFFAWFVVSQFSAMHAMSILGHARVETTFRYYRCAGLSAAMISLWNKAFPAVPPVG